MMGEDKFVFRPAPFERGFQPVVLGFAVADIPLIRRFVAAKEIVVHDHGRTPVRIDRDEERVTPLPRIVVSQQADVLDGLGVARIEIIRRGLGVVEIARVLRPDGDVVRCAVEQVAGGLLVVAVHQEDRRGLAEETEVGALDVVTFRDLRLGDRAGIGLVDRVDAEIVATGQIKIRLVRGHRVHRAGVERGIELGVRTLRMGITLHPEDEGAARRALRHERIFRARLVNGRIRASETDPVKIARVGHESRERDFPRGVGRQQDRVDLPGVTARAGAILQKNRLGRRGEQVGGDRLVRRSSEHNRARKIGGQRSRGEDGGPHQKNAAPTRSRAGRCHGREGSNHGGHGRQNKSSIAARP